MNIDQVKRLLPLTHAAKVTAMIHGKHGVGKSQTIKQYAIENNLRFVDLRLGQMDVGDLLGLADFETDDEGNKIATKFMPPHWWPKAGETQGGVLFLDEINRGRPDVLQAVFQLVLDRRLHGAVLPDNWLVVSAINPNTDNYETTDIFDEALLDRFLHVKLQPKNEEFFAYAKKTGFNPDLINFLQTNEEVLENSKLQDFVLDVKPSKRSWDTVNRLVAAGIPDDMFIEVVGGMVGIENASRYQAYLTDNRSKPFTAEEILNDYKTIAKRVDAYSSLVDGRHDIITVSSQNLTDYLFTQTDLTAKQTKNLYAFMDAIPTDIGFGFMKNTFHGTKDGKNMSEKISDILDKNPKYEDIIMNDKFDTSKTDKKAE